MQSDDDLQTTLSKWPFILGDVLLVITALAIAILGDWQLTNMQVASCVISVALGCGLFVLPYIVEYQVRVREQAEDRSADLRVIKRHLVAAGEEFESIGARIKSLEHGLEDFAQAKPDLTVPIQALEGKLDPLQTQQAEQSAQLSTLAQRMESLAKSFHAFEGLDGKLDPLQNLQTKQSTQLDALLQQVESLAQSLQAKAEMETIQALQTEFIALQALVEAIPLPAVAVPQAELVTESSATAESPVADEPSAKKVRSTRTRRGAEPRLLQRAIEQKQDRSSQAVSRIIEFRSKKPAALVEAPSAEESKVEEPTVEVAKDPLPESDAAVDSVAVEAVATESSEVKDLELEPVGTVDEPAEAEVTEPERHSEGEVADEATSEPEVIADDLQEASESTEATEDEAELESVIAVEEAAEAEVTEPERHSEGEVADEATSEPEVIADDSQEASESTEAAEDEAELESVIAVEEAAEAEVTEPERHSEGQVADEATSEPEVIADDSQESSESTEAGSMSGDAVPLEARKQTRTKKSDTGVIASVFIGIGNKPFVRGSGLGLNWDKGIAMDFEEIGKWRWLASADLAEPVEIQLFRNDEDPDTTGKYTLEPGQELELSPVF
ncbi:hypothetical protein ACWPKO_10760 [Coraliomargarita sp. W4R53]